MGSEIPQSLGWADGVVDVLPTEESLIEGRYLHVAVIKLVELFGVGPLGSLHTAVELRGAWWQDKQSDFSILAGFLKGSLELTATIHLNGFN